MPADVIVLAIPVLLFAALIFTQRRRQRAIADAQAALAPGMLVVTTSGLYAELIELDEQVAVLQTAPGQITRWDRRAVLARSQSTGGGIDAPSNEK